MAGPVPGQKATKEETDNQKACEDANAAKDRHHTQNHEHVMNFFCVESCSCTGSML